MRVKILIALLLFGSSILTSRQAFMKKESINSEDFPIRGIEKLYEMAFAFEKKAASQYLFIRSILHFGTPQHTKSTLNYEVLANTLLSAFKLDPESREIPFFTANNFTLTRKGSEIASKTLRKMTLYREDWRMWAQIGFIKLFYLNKPLQAKRCFKVALEYPCTPSYLKSLMIFACYKGRKYAAGISYILDLLKKCRDERKKLILKRKLLWLIRLSELEKAVRAFLQREKRYPSSLQELVQKGYIREIPKDPWGNGFYWDPQEKRVKSQL